MKNDDLWDEKHVLNQSFKKLDGRESYLTKRDPLLIWIGAIGLINAIGLGWGLYVIA